VKKFPVRHPDVPPDESPIIRDLRVLVDASRKLREEVSELVSHRPRADLRAHLSIERRLKNRRIPRAATANERRPKKPK
jgi:hypothetical protein